MENAFRPVGKDAVIVGGDSAIVLTRKRRPKAQLTCFPAGAEPFSVSGKTARVLRALVRCRHGITALDCIPWTVRLGSMIFQLRHRYGLVIVTEMEPHEGGLHARYFLRTSVAIES